MRESAQAGGECRLQLRPGGIGVAGGNDDARIGELANESRRGAFGRQRHNRQGAARPRLEGVVLGAAPHSGDGTEDVVALRSIWEENGLAPREEMQTTCCYALQDKAWVHDPDGNEWEVFTVLEDNLSEEVQGSAERTCCTPTFTSIDGTKQEVATACC